MINNTVTRIDLPGCGGWWELETRPRVRDALDIAEIQEEERADFKALAIMSRQWQEGTDGEARDVDLDAVLNLRVDDMMPVMQVFANEVIPFLEQLQDSMTPKASSSPSNGNRRSRRATAKSP